ncbi:hypothetical protein ACOSQ2_029033 [Xanthoceras sorbifolium]
MLASDMFVENSVSASKLIYWSPPPAVWVKLNVDGSRGGDLGKIFASGVIRNEDIIWLEGFSINRGEGPKLA